jgi:hypothetical protein
MTEAVSTVLDDLHKMLNFAAITKGFATAGLAEIQLRVSQAQKFPTNPDPTIYVGTGDPNEPGAKSFGFVKSSDLPRLVARGGPIEIQLGRQWAVTVYTEWENTFRPRLAAAHGCDPNEIQVYVFGDLRRIRHDLLHNQAVSTRANSGSCDVLKWFPVGVQVIVTSDLIADFMGRVPWDELAKGPTTATQPTAAPAKG